MIEQLYGKIIQKESGHLILDLDGVGYGLDIPLSTYNQLPRQDENVRLYTHLYVQEDSLRLFGFYTEEERDIFEVLINISGIGPKMGLAILSSLPIEEFARAIANNDIYTLTRIPGIGKKTAERLVLELRGKLERFAYPAAVKDRAVSQEKRKKINDAVEALISLGCRPSVAQKAVWKAVEIVPEHAKLEDLVKESLKHR